MQIHLKTTKNDLQINMVFYLPEHYTSTTSTAEYYYVMQVVSYPYPPLFTSYNSYKYFTLCDFSLQPNVAHLKNKDIPY